MRIRIGKRAETVIIFLSSSIPQSQFYMLSIDFDIGDVIFENGGNINLDNLGQ
jgi:hypothetical protein